MDRRKTLAAALAAGLAAGPVITAAVTLNALVSPAFAAGGHRGHGSSHRHIASRNDSPAGTRTITVRGIYDQSPSPTTIEITRLGRGRNNCLSTPKTETLTIDTGTTFSTETNPTARVTDLKAGDKVAITITVPHGTSPTGVPATSVADLGASAAVACVVRGTAGSGLVGSSFTLDLATGGHRGHRGYHESGRHRSHHANTSTTTASVTVNTGGGTVFVDPGNPSATIASIAPGDRLIVVWSLSPGTAPGSTPAAKVTDLGAPPPIRYRAEGVAAGTPTTTISLTVNHLHPNAAPAFTLGTNLAVQYNGSTVFVDPGNPSATIANIAHGDRLIVVWSAPPGTAAVNLPAASRVIDLGH